MTVAAESAEHKFWFVDKDVGVLIYRINRRPISNPELGMEQIEPFVDHLEQCLQFNSEVQTTGKGHYRRWKLGNRAIGQTSNYIAGVVGYSRDDAEMKDYYDEEKQGYSSTIVATEKVASAPFVVVASSRHLYVAKHPTFSEGALIRVFEDILNNGEAEREHGGSTQWDVQAKTDTPGFERWIQEAGRIDKITWDLKLPNHDADEAFELVDAHLKALEGEVTHTVTPRDKDAGVNKDLSDPLSIGFMEMVRRTYGYVSSVGRSRSGKRIVYNVLQKVKKVWHKFTSTDLETARDELTALALEEDAKDEDNEQGS